MHEKSHNCTIKRRTKTFSHYAHDSLPFARSTYDRVGHKSQLEQATEAPEKGGEISNYVYSHSTLYGYVTSSVPREVKETKLSRKAVRSS